MSSYSVSQEEIGLVGVVVDLLVEYVVLHHVVAFVVGVPHQGDAVVGDQGGAKVANGAGEAQGTWKVD